MPTKTKTSRKVTQRTKLSSIEKLQTFPLPSNLKFNKQALLKNRKILLFLGLIIILVIALLYVFKGVFVAALVNGEPISRISVVSELEKQSGKATLESLITKRLILQEAKKRNVAVGQKDIDAEIKKIEANLKGQGTTLDEALSLQGMTKAQLVSEIEVQIALQKLVSSDVKVSDKEVEEFLTTNKAQFPEGTTEEAMKKEATDQIKSQKLQEKTQAFLADLKKKAKVLNFVNY